MTAAIKVLSETPPASELSALREVFSTFLEASTRLEIRHKALAEETEALRVSLKLKEDEIKKKEKLSALGEMAAALAHEVKNPLGAMRLFTSMLRQDLAGNEGPLKLVEQIDSSIGSLESVVNNILHFSRGKKLIMGPLNVNALLGSLQAFFSKSLKETGRLDLELEGPMFAFGNESALRQVLHNLILNALQATNYGGSVTVATSSADEHLIIRVGDNGPGIDPGQLDRIFEPFVTNKDEGTGLGLAIVKQILDQHGGSIKAESDGGAIFTVRLPLQQSQNCTKLRR